MPTNPRKARLLLKIGKAKVIKREPFTIQLLFGSSGYKQEITLGVDSGSKTVGLSATTKARELFSGELILRNDIVDLLSTRRQTRRTRRGRLRYRKARFLNRVSRKKKGWLAPSIEHKIQTHITIINTICKLLPITKIIVETASFDIQKINNPNICGAEYQQGEQLGFWNVREYVLFRDEHTCQHCKGKKNDKILNVHHIESRKVGGDAPNNLVTLCETCHNDYHKGKIKLNIKRGKSFKDATFMGIMRWTLLERLRLLHNDVSMTFGYITKNTRIDNNLEKTHAVDARCISGNPKAKPCKSWLLKKVRRHNRQIHKYTINKGGTRKLNQSPYEVKGFRLFDKVRVNDTVGFITGRRLTGSFAVKTLEGTKISEGISFKKLELISKRKNILWEVRGSVSLLSQNSMVLLPQY